MEVVDPLGRLRLEVLLAKDAVEGPGDTLPFIARITALASERQRLVLGVALDVSPSMDGERIFFAKNALLKLLDVLEPGDVLVVVGFCRKPFTIYGPKVIESRDDVIEAKRRIAAAKTCPGTNIADALVYTIKLVKEQLEGGGVGRILLVTDGEPTVGEKRPEKIEERVYRALGDVEIPIVAIGVGREYNEAILLRLADATNGDAEHISDILQLEEIVVKEALKAAQVVAQNVRLVINVPPGVEARVYGRKTRREGHTYIIEVGVLSGGEVEDVTGELVAEDVPREGFEAQFRVKYTDPKSQVTIETNSVPVKVRVGQPSFVQQFVLSKVEMVRHSESLKQAILSRNYREAVKHLREIAEATLSLGDISLREKTVDILELIERGEIEEGAKRAATLAQKLTRGENV